MNEQKKASNLNYIQHTQNIIGYAELKHTIYILLASMFFKIQSGRQAVHAFNPGTQEEEPVEDQSVLSTKGFHYSQDYTEK